jgi:predicted nucleic acid-binding protein
LGLLLRAKRLGYIAALKPAIDLLRTKAGFFVAPSLEARVVAAAGE